MPAGGIMLTRRRAQIATAQALISPRRRHDFCLSSLIVRISADTCALPTVVCFEGITHIQWASCCVTGHIFIAAMYFTSAAFSRRFFSSTSRGRFLGPHYFSAAISHAHGWFFAFSLFHCRHIFLEVFIDFWRLFALRSMSFWHIFRWFFAFLLHFSAMPIFSASIFEHRWFLAPFQLFVFGAFYHDDFSPYHFYYDVFPVNGHSRERRWRIGSWYRHWRTTLLPVDV